MEYSNARWKLSFGETQLEKIQCSHGTSSRSDFESRNCCNSTVEVNKNFVLSNNFYPVLTHFLSLWEKSFPGSPIHRELGITGWFGLLSLNMILIMCYGFQVFSPC